MLHNGLYSWLSADNPSSIDRTHNPISTLSKSTSQLANSGPKNNPYNLISTLKNNLNNTNLILGNKLNDLNPKTSIALNKSTSGDVLNKITTTSNSTHFKSNLYPKLTDYDYGRCLKKSTCFEINPGIDENIKNVNTRHNRPANNNSVDQIIAGIISGSICRVLVQPFDVIKIHLQLQQYQCKSATNQITSKYSGIFNCTYTICHEEGIRSLWKGHISAQILSMIYGSSQFFMYNYWLHAIQTKWPSDTRNSHFISSFIAGGISGCVSTFISYPFDLLRTRMVIQHKNKIYKNIFDAIKQLYIKEGISSFYRGLYLSLLEVFTTAGFQFGIYTFLKDVLRPLSYLTTAPVNDTNHKANYESIIYGSCSGAFARIFTIPINTVKKRRQNIGFEKNMAHLGSQEYFKINTYNWIQQIISGNQKLRILFAGSTPAVLKSFVYSGSLFYTYEKMMELLLLFK